MLWANELGFWIVLILGLKRPHILPLPPGASAIGGEEYAHLAHWFRRRRDTWRGAGSANLQSWDVKQSHSALQYCCQAKPSLGGLNPRRSPQVYGTNCLSLDAPETMGIFPWRLLIDTDAGGQRREVTPSLSHSWLVSNASLEPTSPVPRLSADSLGKILLSRRSCSLWKM